MEYDYRDNCLVCPFRHKWTCSAYGEPLWFAIKVCRTNPINKDTTKQNIEEDNNG